MYSCMTLATSKKRVISQLSGAEGGRGGGTYVPRSPTNNNFGMQGTCRTGTLSTSAGSTKMTKKGTTGTLGYLGRIYEEDGVDL